MIDNLIREMDRVAIENADRVVFDEMGQTHTYHDLLVASNSFAAWLDREKIIAEHSPIMFYGDHQFEMLAGFVGGLKAGHAYIPVEVGSSIPRVKSILGTANPRLVVAIDDFPARELGYDGAIITRDELQKIFADQLTYQLAHEARDNDLFYILFTSGTTGSPKGVQISHNNICSFVNWMLSDAFKLPAKQTYLGQAPFSFDLAHMYWLTALLSGGTIQALPLKVVQNLGQLFTTLPQLDISVFVSTPSFCDMALLSPQFNAQQMPNLKYFIFCGEELTTSTVKRIYKNFPDAHVFNTYGPTEAAVAVTSIEITPAMAQLDERLPIGYDKPGVTTSIWLDGKPVSQPNTRGEIIISGDSVAQGYLNNPAKTEQNFFKYNGVQSYRTGDEGYIDEHGIRHIVGRMDFQIKMHGFRIELDEVRNGLELSEYVKQAVAVPKYNKDHQVSHLIAEIIPQPNTCRDEKELTKAIRQSLKGKLMDYMMPTQFIYVDKFPKSANGKIAVKQMIAEANQ